MLIRLRGGGAKGSKVAPAPPEALETPGGVSTTVRAPRLTPADVKALAEAMANDAATSTNAARNAPSLFSEVNADAQALFHEIDNNEGGEIEVDEWLSFLLAKGLSHETIMQWWRLADADSSGGITKAEYAAVAVRCGSELGVVRHMNTPPQQTLAEMLPSIMLAWDNFGLANGSVTPKEQMTHGTRIICTDGGAVPQGSTSTARPVELPAEISGDLYVPRVGGLLDICIGYVRRRTAEEATTAEEAAPAPAEGGE